MKRLIMLTGVVAAACAVFAKPPTKVQFWFDTEDYTYDGSNDAIRDIANLLTEEGVRGHFNIVGYLAKFIQEKRRFDVIDALRPHLVGSQTMYHWRGATRRGFRAGSNSVKNRNFINA